MGAGYHRRDCVLASALAVFALFLTLVLPSARGQSPAAAAGVSLGEPFEYDGAPGSKFTIVTMNGKPGMIIEEVAGQRIQSMITGGRADVVTVQQGASVLYVKGQTGKEALVNAAAARANGALAFRLSNPGAAASPPPAQNLAPPAPPPSNALSPSTVPAPSAAPGAPPAGAPEVRFDEAAHAATVSRPDGVIVTFVGEDVKIAGFRRLSYIVRRQKGSPGRFLERSLGHSAASGGSISGGGLEFLREGGGIIYDSGMGTERDRQVDSPVLLAKQLSQVAVDAVAAVRQVPGHENFMPPGYNTLKEISQYRLRSDGSR